MSHEVLRLHESLFNVPLLALPQTIDAALEYLSSRNAGSFELTTAQKEFTDNRQPEFDSATKTGILRISGPLSYKSTIMTALCGLTSYQKIEVDFKKLINLGANKVVLWVDSGGGEAYSCFETAALLRNLADKNNIRLTSYVDGVAGSAAYALSSAAHEIVMNPFSEVGSVGVVVKLRNSNKALQKAGIEDTFIHAGKSKIPFDASGDWSKSFKEDLQIKVDTLFENFVSFIAGNRGISIADVKSTQAKMFLAPEALKLGLADKILDKEKFWAYINAAASTKPVNTSPVKSATKPMSKAEFRERIKSGSWAGAKSAKTKPALSNTDDKSFRRVSDVNDGVSRFLRKPVDAAQVRNERINTLRQRLNIVDVNAIYESTKHLTDEQFNNRLSQL